MPDLAATQRLISDALRDGARGAAALPLISGDPAHAHHRLAIYRGNVSANAALALAATFPVVSKLVGAEFFDALARAYGGAHPSLSGDLNELGADFAAFVATFQPAQSLPYLADVARMEWRAHQAHYAADHAPLAVDKLPAIDESAYPRLVVTLDAAVSTMASAFPLFRIWEVHQEDYRGEMTVDFDCARGHIIVYRSHFRAAVASLTQGEAAFLDAIKTGNVLGPALETALTADRGFDFAASLQRWTVANIVV
ncbi:MAG: DNA-binding domain-containing protein, partial [Burkholderiales bacterium]